MRDAYQNPDRVYGHGAEPEVSAMLAMFPEEVRRDSYPHPELTPFSGWSPTSYTEAAIPPSGATGEIFWDFSDVCPSGTTGSFEETSREMGEQWVERVIGFCVDYVREFDRNTKQTAPSLAAGN
jgi:creatinine amidohydrolase